MCILRSVKIKNRRTQKYDFQIEVFRRGGSRNFSERGPIHEVWGTEVYHWGLGQSPGWGHADKVPHELKQNVKLVYHFDVFLHKMKDLMSRSRAWTIFLRKHTIKNSRKFNGGRAG